MTRILLLAAITLPAIANATSIFGPEFDTRSLPGTPNGYVVNGVTMSFEGQLFFNELVVTLSQGSIYQDMFGSQSPPHDDIISFLTSLESDSFIAMGGYTSGSSSGVLVVGGSAHLGTSELTKFDSEGIDITWAPWIGEVMNGGIGFPIAQITLSDDAFGSWRLYNNVDGVGVVTVGAISSGYFHLCPEPASVLLVGVAFCAAIARRSW